jgi:hypothetical protein
MIEIEDDVVAFLLTVGVALMTYAADVLFCSILFYFVLMLSVQMR